MNEDTINASLGDSRVADAADTGQPPNTSGTQNDSSVVIPVWCPVATMTSERPSGPGGDVIQRGSKHFAPGARLYFRRVMGYDGDDMARVEVVGRHSGSHRYVRMIVRGEWLENWHADLVYSPYVAKELQPYWDGTLASKEEAEFFVQKFSR